MPTFKAHFIFFLFIQYLLIYNVRGQGCSDAGFCTLNGFKPDIEDSTNQIYKNYLSVGFSQGEADYSISVLSAYIEYHRSVSEKISADIKLTGMNHTDTHISTTGFSDLYLNTGYTFLKNTTALAGFKIPLQDGNKVNDEGTSLPMDYQASLGTLDVILGLKYEVKKLSVTAGLQQPMIQNNNHYLSENYPSNSPFKNFQSTNNYKRSGDVLLRITYPVKITKHFTVSPSALAIYHLKDDRYTPATGPEQSIQGSQGLTFNGTLYFDYILSEKSSIDLNMGKPFITRKTRPDGLTREYIITLEYKFKF
ncbi:MAG: hypothetical protein ACTHJT_10110 [Cytophaga sp.]|uniref:hypothetical protein n=1 Tax=Cytophaga sp. TaxID=29535 RepID=UPI003F81721A